MLKALLKLNPRRGKLDGRLQAVGGLIPEPEFCQKLVLERKRAERSSKPLLLMVLDVELAVITDPIDTLLSSISKALHDSLRDTDVCGLFGESRRIGVILTEIEGARISDAKQAVALKVREKLSAALKKEVAAGITLTFKLFPETGAAEDAFDVAFYPDVGADGTGSMANDIAKRTLDVVGSVGTLVLLSPVILVISMLIKLTSEGPVFFKQERLGQNGKLFKLLKFRTMFVNNDDSIHRDYIKKLIEGQLGNEGPENVFKITADPRVTSVGRRLRKYSLDELPQLFNVLTGDMSLVGPRPPIPYELEHYSGWQRKRLIGRKPGITGVWQVSGRSKTTFDEMVRIDLRYLRDWNILLDLKILLQTPLAVLQCRGAY